MTAVEHFIEALRRHGVDWMATLCGFGLNPLYHAAKKAGIRLIDTRNEQAASFMADAWGRLTRRPGVCAVSSGVAHANALSGVVNAWFDSAPLLLISGGGPLRTAGLGHFQDFPQAAMAVPVARYCRVIDCPDRAVQILDEALEIASGPPPGPVHLTFPLDIQTAVVENPVRCAARRALPSGGCEAVAESLAGAERPLIVAGSGVYYAGGGADLVDFSERCSIPLVVPIWDRGIVDRPCATFMGVLGAATGGPDLLGDADCLILAGAAADYRVGHLQRAGLRVVRLDHGFQGLRLLQARPFTSWLEEARRGRDAFRLRVEQNGASQAERGLHAYHIMAALRQVLTDETVLLIDGGSVGQWAHQTLCRDRYPGHWLTCGRSGVVGWGIGGAMAARLAFPSRPVILLAGDGAFTFTVAELECAVRQRLPFVALVADDQAWGITKIGHVEEFGEAIASTLGPIAFDRLAETLGARGCRATAPDAILAELRKALEQDTVTVIHVPVTGGNP